LKVKKTRFIKETPSASSSSSTLPDAGLRVLVITSVDAERDAILRGLLYKPHGFNVVAGGVGTAAAAASTAKELSANNYDIVINAGICGGFIERTELASIVVASEIIAADLGAQTPEGFIRLDELGFGTTRIPVDQSLVNQVLEALQSAGLPVTAGPILSVSTVTGTAETTLEMIKRVPLATAEAMEGYGVAMAAQLYGVPILEVRAVSNIVGPRDRDSWRIKEALKRLESASSILQEVLR
jgi:futalosine hydrolase